MIRETNPVAPRDVLTIPAMNHRHQINGTRARDAFCDRLPRKSTITPALENTPADYHTLVLTPVSYVCTRREFVPYQIPECEINSMISHTHRHTHAHTQADERSSSSVRDKPRGFAF